MEDKSFNFNQPLLSVRRFGPCPTFISHKTEERKTCKSPHRRQLKSSPVTNPGTVPFLWEQTPGQPKEEIKPQKESFLTPPKLPPGRSPRPKQEEREKHDRKDQALKGEGDNRIENVENAKKTTDKESSVSGDSDGEYVDALDTLSRSESFFLNCSVSEWDDLDVKPSRSFSMDPHALESMMDRFLPAAKAAVSEMPHYATKRHPVTQEHPPQLKQTYRFKSLVHYGPSITMQYPHYLVNEVGDKESDDDCDQRDNSTGACGLLPRFCLKSSFSLLNPITAMSMSTRGSTSSHSKIRPRSSPAGSFSEIINEGNSDKMDINSEVDLGKDELMKERGQLESCSMLTDCAHDIPASEGRDEQTNGRTKGTKTFQQLIADEDNLEGLVSEGFSVEKTLYVDTVQKVESPNSRKEIPREDTNKLDDVNGEEKLVPNVEKCDELRVLSSIDDTCRMEIGKDEDNKLKKTKEGVEFHKKYPGPPALPKSPADSWLFRTMCEKNSKNPQKRGLKMPIGDSKWETIVKTAKVHQGLMRSISNS